MVRVRQAQLILQIGTLIMTVGLLASKRRPTASPDCEVDNDSWVIRWYKPKYFSRLRGL